MFVLGSKNSGKIDYRSKKKIDIGKVLYERKFNPGTVKNIIFQNDQTEMFFFGNLITKVVQKYLHEILNITFQRNTKKSTVRKHYIDILLSSNFSS
jgi:hypothetical protein